MLRIPQGGFYALFVFISYHTCDVRSHCAVIHIHVTASEGLRHYNEYFLTARECMRSLALAPRETRRAVV
jgi:hypothetical protein